MMNCRICGERSSSRTCDGCGQVAVLVEHILEPMFVIVDGSYLNDHGGAGLVLVVGSLVGDVAASCACRFHACSSAEAEFQAIVRGRRWAPGVPVYSDCESAIRGTGNPANERERRRMIVRGTSTSGVHFILEQHRKPNHQLAHRLSRVGRREQTAVETRARAELAR